MASAKHQQRRMLQACLFFSSLTLSLWVLANDLATTSELGSSHSVAVIEQSGAYNSAMIVQHGNGNASLIDQSGVLNKAGVDQYGNGNTAYTLQEGALHEASILQHGQYHDALIIQQGVGQSASIQQTGIGGSATLLQQASSQVPASITQYSRGHMRVQVIQQ
ncbi:hypothetical protein [Cobetia sp. 1AS1]|uniref:hypothetical protein n=1 Tax=Cobetia sp. 1AS1 TaxID=3040016 RepID=UPI0024493294|nr:hypothetical protein [Cobetia sp. 1AS1]MDH2294584.1 hypothetical protein [Cobetia sp. 1AS1]